MLVLIIGLVISALGVSLCINSLLPCSPVDQLIVSISSKFNITQGKSKMVIDIVCLLLGLLLGSSIGIGTIVVVALFGTCLNWFNKMYKGLIIRYNK